MLHRTISVLAAATALLLFNCQPKPSQTDKTPAESTAKTVNSIPSTTTVSTDSAVATRPASGTLSPLDSLGLIGPKITGPILPGKRIVAYYGNPHSKRMGALGEYPKDDMLRRLDATAKEWEQGDTTGLKVQTALHLVATSAQGAPGKDGYYRMRMSDKTIRKVIKWAAEHNSICFLDIQVGLAPLQPELDYMEKYLKLPYVHLGIDPEFSMKTGARPGTRIGTYDAADVWSFLQVHLMWNLIV